LRISFHVFPVCECSLKSLISFKTEECLGGDFDVGQVHSRHFHKPRVLQAAKGMLFSRTMKFFISMLSLIGFAPVALAAQATPKPTSLWQVIESGGVMMYPLAALSVLALSLIFVFVFTLRRGSVVTRRYMQAADALLRKKDHLSLLAVSNRHRDAVASVMEKSLYFLTNHPGATITEVREVAMAEGVRLAGLWNQRVSYLADIGSIAPMVGLFGTVLGMIKSFTAVSGEMATSRSLLLSSGVAEALIATAAGLVIGIPAMAAFAFFRGRVQAMVSELEASSTVLMAQLSIGMPARNNRD